MEFVQVNIFRVYSFNTSFKNFFFDKVFNLKQVFDNVHHNKKRSFLFCFVFFFAIKTEYNSIVD